MSGRPDPLGGGGWRLRLQRRSRWLAHLFKAVAYQYHRALLPPLRQLIPAEGVVFDIGAHAGQFTKLFAGIAVAGRVYAVEPGAYALSILRPVVALRRLGQVRIVDIGFSDVPGRGDIVVPVKSHGALGFGLAHLASDETAGDGVSHPIRLMRLDDFVAAEPLTRLDFIKLDIEGWEVRCLAGAQETLRRFRPAVLLEVRADTLARAGNAPEEVWEIFETLRYRCFAAPEHENYRLTPVEPGAPLYGDYLFVPEERAFNPV